MSEPYDLLIKNALIVDGTGRPAFRGGLATRGERIVAVGEASGEAAETIDAAGLTLCPGFIDAHDHADASLLEYPLVENLVMQGITTFVGGNCGYSGGGGFAAETSPADRTFGQWLDQVEENGISPNYAPLVGHNTLRWAVMGPQAQRKATAGERAKMEAALEEAMEAGAFGFTTGLDAFHPAHFGDVEELISLVRIAGKHGRLFSPHTRHHQNQWPAASPEEFGYGVFHAPKGELIAGRYHGLIEAIEVARAAGEVPLHIAHLTPAYIVPQPHPAFLDEALARATLLDIVDKPRQAGLNVTFNVLGMEWSIGAATSLLDSLWDLRQPLPAWFKAMPKEDLVKKLGERAFRAQLKELFLSGKFKFGMIHPLTDPYWMDCYQILRCKNAAYAGKTLGEIARARRPDRAIDAVYDAAYEALFDILLDDPATIWALVMDKREYGVLTTFLQHPLGMPVTDVSALPAQPEKTLDVPPIAFSMMPHFLRRFVKEEKLLSLEAAIQKVTGMPAGVFGIPGRGVLQAGAFADLVLLDFEQLREDNSFLEPARPSEGIERVIINGETTYAGKKHTGVRAGKVLRAIT